MAASFTGPEQRTTPNREDVGCSSQHLGDVFLSHSGRQKPFVERLYDALVRANHTVFLDKHSLPLGSPFPDNFKRALRGCKVGVIILSEDFLTSLWPMIELGLLFENNKPVVPLFYLLSTEDLKSDTNLRRWQKKWKEMAKDEQQENQWAAAVKKLRIFNGIVFNKEQEKEAAYIIKVVTKICSDYHPYVRYDQSSMQGIEALAKVITRHFDKLAENVNHPVEACVVGLHGVGGLGKTTLCKSMVNFYNSKYPGRSYLIEFPTTRDMGMVVEECQMATRQLFNLSDEGLKVKDFDQAVAQIKKHAGTFDVFLAIDNIWEHSIEEVGRLLGVGFTAKSKVLLTSRSREILLRLLSHTIQKKKDHYHIDCLPVPNMEVAFQIFQQIVKQDDLTSLRFGYRIKSVLERCSEKNHGGYHPLAVRALGAIAARLSRRRDSKRNTDSWSLILQELENAEMKDVNATIRLNYDNLDEDLQHIFLDIGILFSSPAFKHFLKCTYADVSRWLQFFYKFNEMGISALVDDLAAAGVIRIEKAQYDEEMIEVHDLYVELACKEATKSPRFLTSTKEAVEGMERGNLKRVILDPFGQKLQLHQFEKLQLHQCEKLELLYVNGIELHHFPESIASLRVLILLWPRDFDSKRTLLNLNGFVNLEYLRLENLPFVKLQSQNGFPSLRMFFLRNCARVEDLDILRFSTQLEALVIDSDFCDTAYGGAMSRQAHPLSVEVNSLCPLKGPEVWKNWPDLSNTLQHLEVFKCMALRRLPDLSPALKLLNVTGCTALWRLPDLGGLTSLETLWLHNNTSLMEMGAFSPALKTVIITDCQAVRLPDLGSVTGLEVLILRNTDLSEVGHLSSAVKFVSIDRCCMLKKMSALGSMMGLQRLTLTNNALLEEVVSLGPALRYLHVEGCGALKRMRDLEGVTKLKLLSNASLEEVGSLCPALEHLEVSSCAALKTMPELESLTSLEELSLRCNDSLEEVGCLSPALTCLKILRCAALKMMPGLEGLTALQRLEVAGFDALKRLPGLEGLTALQILRVSDCHALKRLPELAGLTSLEELSLRDNASLEEVGRLSPALTWLEVLGCAALKTMPELEGLTALQRLKVSGCHALKRLPELAGLTSLHELELRANASLKEVGRLSPALTCLEVWRCAALKTIQELEGLTALVSLTVGGFRALKRLPELAGLTSLTSLKLSDSPSLEELGRLSPLLKRLEVLRCAALKTMPELEGLTALRELIVKNCHALKRLPELAGLTSLFLLRLRDNASLEEVGRLSPALAILADRALKSGDHATNIWECEGGVRLLISNCPKLRTLNGTEILPR